MGQNFTNLKNLDQGVIELKVKTTNVKNIKLERQMLIVLPFFNFRTRVTVEHFASNFENFSPQN